MIVLRQQTLCNCVAFNVCYVTDVKLTIFRQKNLAY